MRPVPYVAGASAVAANKLNKPVRLIVDLQSCMRMFGKRLPYYAKYQVNFVNCFHSQLHYHALCSSRLVSMTKVFCKKWMSKFIAKLDQHPLNRPWMRLTSLFKMFINVQLGRWKDMQ